MQPQRASAALRRNEAGTPLHEERLNVVARRLLDSGARSVLDLGCGCGFLLSQLVREGQFTRLVGVDCSMEALASAAALLGPMQAGERGRLTLRHGSFAAADEDLSGFDAAAMVETIEHLPPTELSLLERSVFRRLRPALVVITTPNRDFNRNYGLGAHELRHGDHRFEWGRHRFERWASGVGARNGYRVSFEAIGPWDRWDGGPTQMALFNDGGPRAAGGPDAVAEALR